MKKHKIKCKFILSYGNREDVVLDCEYVTDRFSDEIDEQVTLEKIKSSKLVTSDGEELIPGEELVYEIDDVEEFGLYPIEYSEHEEFIRNLVDSGDTVVRELDTLFDENGNLVEIGYVDGVRVPIEPTMTLGDDGVWNTHPPTPIPENKLQTYKKKKWREEWKLIEIEGDYDPVQPYSYIRYEFISVGDETWRF